MPYDESEALTDLLEYGWLDVNKENEVICWVNGKTYKAKITFSEIEE